jgi:two-component system, response regulator PdtaR
MGSIPASATPDTRTRVLVVENDQLARWDLSSALRATGFEVFEAESADSAITFIETGKPVDVMFTDIDLPGMLDGLALGNIMRAARPMVPVIFCFS